MAEAEAISGATQCQKYLFSLSLKPPPGAEVSVEGFETTIGQVEKRLGLSGQPRAIVFHEKNGRRHAHAVWSRIDGSELKAINLPHYKRKLCGLSQELYRAHDWEMPAGFVDAAKRDPLNYTRQEAGQARRLQRDPKVLKKMFRGYWEASDSKAGFEAALKEQGFQLARGDRRGFVAVDAGGKIWSLSRWCGVKPKDMRRAFGGELSHEQRASLRHALGDKQLSSVVGLAGAGKSTMLATARDAWARQGITVHGAALAGKAAEELENASGITSRTLASLELSWKNGYEPIAKGDILVVDEAGMIGTRQLARVAAKVSDIGAKLVLVGDPDQLQPIEAGTPFRRVVKDHGAARLTEIHRQKANWQRQASRDLAAGDLSKAVDQYRKRNAVTQAHDRASALEALVETYAMDVAANGISKSRLAFAHKRKDVHALNLAIRAALRSGDNLEPETLFPTATGQRAFAKNDRIAFTRNNKTIGVKNGMLGTIVTAQNGKISVSLDGNKPRTVTFNPNHFKNVDHGYAVTIHKSQGATVDQAYVLASRSMDRHLAYVAMTRHREDMRLFVNNEDRPGWAMEQQRHVRARTTHTRNGPSMG